MPPTRKSGTAEFKAAAIRVDKIVPLPAAERAEVELPAEVTGD